MVAFFDAAEIPAALMHGGQGLQLIVGEQLEGVLPTALRAELSSEVASRRRALRSRTDPGSTLDFEWRGWHVRAMDVSRAVHRPLVIGLLESLPTPKRLGTRLTPRQREVAHAAAHGESAPQLAARLGISVHTVRRHLEEIYRRLGIGKRTELVRLLAIR